MGRPCWQARKHTEACNYNLNIFMLIDLFILLVGHILLAPRFKENRDVLPRPPCRLVTRARSPVRKKDDRARLLVPFENRANRTERPRRDQFSFALSRQITVINNEHHQAAARSPRRGRPTQPHSVTEMEN